MSSAELVSRINLPELTQERVNELLAASEGVINIPEDFQFSVAIVDNSEIQTLNERYRHKEGPTDVLSFPYGNNTGDIVISADKVMSQAQEYGHSVAEEAAFLLVHGIVHIMGWDHERSEAEAKDQAQIEAKILESCGLNYVR
ncbi:MAG: rRNA maturation RNase YbeY [Candidatus Kerfeldbacteria bacterium CG15_BIG_FIL_POST_REV_8_21_14_020_45_12]|uniref:Endoribonuclease YbeY n=1 Tax=Candidatus Kerfeldbacteria bacterium CG15_BIG_FIL_POST_REV_8_21_14_020_45_12 TaxID=2014247 RepID=A0A2M7H3L8_9BACT|nr:MAG: rRNA maturation RNase YbeY [Candidatus Kerfeldbacteria bacterium CG15_BIG_FIL_POST_REV_8_21_14_020_45_12]PJA93444.1 MAG: rRNA maturation RNase YbeY [Candidatus Kerfeldbacteria bacterium CG_4_9_14_3_um_filter_45_8]